MSGFGVCFLSLAFWFLLLGFLFVWLIQFGFGLGDLSSLS